MHARGEWLGVAVAAVVAMVTAVVFASWCPARHAGPMYADHLAHIAHWRR